MDVFPEEEDANSDDGGESVDDEYWKPEIRRKFTEEDRYSAKNTRHDIETGYYMCSQRVTSYNGGGRHGP